MLIAQLDVPVSQIDKVFDINLSQPRRGVKSDGAIRCILSPLPGLNRRYTPIPGLTPGG
jgi:hypothetical protein